MSARDDSNNVAIDESMSTATATALDAGNTEHYQVYRRRWVFLFLFAGTALLNNCICFTFAPIEQFAITHYGEGAPVDWMVTVFFMVYVVFSFPTSWIIEQRGLRFGCVLGVWLQAIGAALRVVFKAAFPHISAHNEFKLVAVGQFIASFGQAFYVNPPPMFAATWFPVHERTLATTLACNSNSLGIATAYALAPLLVDVPDDIPKLLGVVSVLSLTFAVLITAFMPDAPPTPPSRTAMMKRQQMQPSRNVDRSLKHSGKQSDRNGHAGTTPLADVPLSSFSISSSISHGGDSVVELSTNGHNMEPADDGQDFDDRFVHMTLRERLRVLMGLFHERGFLHTVVAFAATEGILNGVSASMNWMLHAYPQGFVSLMACLFIVVAQLGSGLVGFIVDRTHRHKFWLFMTMLATTVSLIWFTLVTVLSNSTIPVVFSILCMGFFLGPIQPISMELAAECTYPSSEASTTAIQQVSGNLLSSALIPVLTALREPNGDMVRGNWFLVCWMLAATVFFLFFNGETRRLAAESVVSQQLLLENELRSDSDLPPSPRATVTEPNISNATSRSSRQSEDDASLSPLPTGLDTEDALPGADASLLLSDEAEHKTDDSVSRPSLLSPKRHRTSPSPPLLTLVRAVSPILKHSAEQPSQSTSPRKDDKQSMKQSLLAGSDDNS